MMKENSHEEVLAHGCLLFNETFVRREEAIAVLRRKGIRNPEKRFADLERRSRDGNQGAVNLPQLALKVLYEVALRSRP